MKLIVLTIFSALIVSGCLAGDGAGLDENGLPFTDMPTLPEEPPENDTPDPSPGGDGSQDATLANLQEKVFTPICAQCHFGTNAPVGLRLDSLEESERNLIGVTAVLNPQFQRVAEGDPENSFLYLKIIGDPVAGNRMPLGLPALSDETIQLFREWIENGAVVQALQPVVGKVDSRKKAKPLTVTFTFSHLMNTESLQTDQILVQSNFDSSEQVWLEPITDYESKWLKDNQLEVSILNVPRDSESMFIRFNDASLSTAVGQNGFVLDGDYDGKAGGEYSYEFQL